MNYLRQKGAKVCLVSSKQPSHSSGRTLQFPILGLIPLFPPRKDINLTFHSGMNTKLNTRVAFSHTVQVCRKETIFCDYFSNVPGATGDIMTVYSSISSFTLSIRKGIILREKWNPKCAPFWNPNRIYSGLTFIWCDFFPWHFREANNFRGDVLTNSSIDQDKRQEVLIKHLTRAMANNDIIPCSCIFGMERISLGMIRKLY